MRKIMKIKQWEDLCLLEKEIIPRELDRYMKTYRIGRNRRLHNDCFTFLSFCDFRLQVCHRRAVVMLAMALIP